MGLKGLAFLIGPLYVNGMWFSVDQKAHMSKRNWTMSSNINNYFTLNNEPN